MQRTTYLAALGFIAAMATTSADAQTVTIGTSAPTAPNCIPFGCPESYAMFRYQQVYAAGAFGVAGPILISGLSFYHTTGIGTDLGRATFSFFLSSTSAAVNGLSTTFDANVGADNTAFATLTLTGDPAPTQLDLSGTPFLYDPASAANLLIDVVITGVGFDGLTAFFDSDNSGSETSRAYNSAVGNHVSGSGLVTTFTYRPLVSATPEPATLSLLATGLVALAARRRRRRALS